MMKAEAVTQLYCAALAVLCKKNDEGMLTTTEQCGVFTASCHRLLY